VTAKLSTQLEKWWKSKQQMKTVKATCVFLLAALCCLGAGAQSTGTISGVIVDQVGNPLAGAFIAARNEATQATTRVTADAEGRFFSG
jgi:hypothetical protein